MFNPNAFKLIRSLYGYTLDEIAKRIHTTRQYVHAIENGIKLPSNEHIAIFSMIFGVSRDYFFKENNFSIQESEVHFRKLRTTKQALKLQTIARLELVNSVLKVLENELDLPTINFPSLSYQEFSLSQIETIAEKCRDIWGVGQEPISNMTRLAENNGALVLDLDNTSSNIDALSIFQDRPIILRNIAKESICRRRFDIAHEIGHFILHRGRPTGDKQTENEANAFASALLLPKSVMIKEFPRPSRNRINWPEISAFKLKWKASKAACFYRAHKIGLLTDAQYKTAVIQLRCKGESIVEKEDYLIEEEKPELILNALNIVDKFGFEYVASALSINESTLRKILSLPVQSPTTLKFSNLN
ncbi:MAG: XRE family transcriptional regulator [Neisseria zoodegmatis]|uniref:XRE family transcriptional regulator n=1 Tax=Neisseria zoodegmatis TaxID=326523 RepID=UPI0026EB3230|nr:XRE family transcriptional regulator [Neisseria zoodegmatis]MDO5069416.1 XRE family transcriptional regulator [Neisseria zoodegmatis]